MSVAPSLSLRCGTFLVHLSAEACSSSAMRMTIEPRQGGGAGEAGGEQQRVMGEAVRDTMLMSTQYPQAGMMKPGRGGGYGWSG